MVKQTDRPDPEPENGSINGPGDGSELQPTCELLSEPKPEPIIKPADGLKPKQKHKVTSSLFLCQKQINQ